jgi:hypothetical protein
MRSSERTYADQRSSMILLIDIKKDPGGYYEIITYDIFPGIGLFWKPRTGYCKIMRDN